MAPTSNNPSLAQQAENLKNDAMGVVQDQKDNVGVDRSALQKTKDFIGVDRSKYQEANDKVGTEKSLAQQATDFMSGAEQKTNSSDVNS